MKQPADSTTSERATAAGLLVDAIAVDASAVDASMVDAIVVDATVVDAIAAESIAATKAKAHRTRLSGVVVGDCIDDRHPQLTGRVLVRIVDEHGERTCWMATLANQVVRRGDRVLVQQPNNWDEPVVIGVLDALRQRTVQMTTTASVELQQDEQIEIRDHHGAPLLTIVPTPTGPVLRLARADQRLEIAGCLTFAASAIELHAKGNCTITAGGDVVVNGEEIKLN